MALLLAGAWLFVKSLGAGRGLLLYQVPQVGYTIMRRVAFIHYTAELRIPEHAPMVSLAILGGWLVLALSGSWRPEPTWIDRAGRGLAFAWIFATAVQWISDCLG
jgi:hypothetical protein